MSRADEAEALFRSGCTCSQAVVLAFADKTGLPRETLSRLSSPFGGGMGRLREVCGAVSGMLIVLGLCEGTGDSPSPSEKAALYGKVRLLADAFKEQNGSIVCRELLSGAAVPQSDISGTIPRPRTDEYYKKRPCPGLVREAVSLLDDYLEGRLFSEQ